MNRATSERQAAAAKFLGMPPDVLENRFPETVRETDDALNDRLDYVRSAKIVISLRKDISTFSSVIGSRMPPPWATRFELRLLSGLQARKAVIESRCRRCQPSTCWRSSA